MEFPTPNGLEDWGYGKLTLTSALIIAVVWLSRGRLIPRGTHKEAMDLLQGQLLLLQKTNDLLVQQIAEVKEDRDEWRARSEHNEKLAYEAAKEAESLAVFSPPSSAAQQLPAPGSCTSSAPES